jgi:hypothetical protein
MQIYEQATGLWALQSNDGSIHTFATESEAIMATIPTAAQEFEALQGSTRATAQALIRQVSEVSDLLDANPQILSMAAAAESGEIIGNTGMTKEAVLLGIALIKSYLAYIDSNLATTSMTVRQAVYRLG